VSNTVI